MKCGLLNWIRKSSLKVLSTSKLTRSLFLAFSLICCTLCAEIDLEEYIADFILETKQIQVPNHPHAFNPSIVEWQGDLFLSFREVKTPFEGIQSASESLLYLVHLDENFLPIEEPKLLVEKALRAEDGRLLVVGDHLYLIYSNNQDDRITDGGFRIYIAKLHLEQEDILITHHERISYFPGESSEKREKNWVPFSHQNQLLFAYSLSPHKILAPFLDGSQCADEIFSTNPSIVWRWGELRGGTPAIPINDKFYLSFFHSSISLQTIHSNASTSLHYFIGAYLFEKNPPFRVMRVSPEPIVGQNFYRGKKYNPYWKPVNVVFPCGLIKKNDEVWVVYGRQDHEIWLAKIDLEGLLASLIPVTTVEP